MTTAPGVIGVDVGGTTIKAVQLDTNSRVVADIRCATPVPDPTGAGVVAAVSALVDAIGGNGDVPVGVVVPGVVDEEHGIAVRSANIGWRDIPLRADLENRIGRQIAFGHDVRAGALAEYRTGAARGCEEVMAFVAVGTGVAAATLVNGNAVVSGGWAGEIGQQVLGDGPFAGMRVEQVASASAAARRAGETDARALAARVAAGDVDAQAVWADTLDVLAGALAGLVVTVAPSTIVLGGGLPLAGDLFLDPLVVALARRVHGVRCPRLLAAAHGDVAAALGAAMLGQDLAEAA